MRLPETPDTGCPQPVACTAPLPLPYSMPLLVSVVAPVPPLGTVTAEVEISWCQIGSAHCRPPQEVSLEPSNWTILFAAVPTVTPLCGYASAITHQQLVDTRGAALDFNLSVDIEQGAWIRSPDPDVVILV